MDKDYEITEQDVDKALNYLKYHDPENATRENAEALLQDLQQGYHNMAHSNPELLEGLKRELDNSGSTNTTD